MVSLLFDIVSEREQREGKGSGFQALGIPVVSSQSSGRGSTSQRWEGVDASSRVETDPDHWYGVKSCVKPQHSKVVEDDDDNEDERRCRGVAGEGLVREAKAGC